MSKGLLGQVNQTVTTVYSVLSLSHTFSKGFVYFCLSIFYIHNNLVREKTDSERLNHLLAP